MIQTLRSYGPTPTIMAKMLIPTASSPTLAVTSTSPILTVRNTGPTSTLLTPTLTAITLAPGTGTHGRRGRGTKRSVPRAPLQHRRKPSTHSPWRPSHPPPLDPSTHPIPSLWRASTAGMKKTDVPRPTPTTHGDHHQYQKIVWKPRSTSVLVPTPTMNPATRTPKPLVYAHETQHLPTPTQEQLLRRLSTLLKFAI